MAKISHLLLVDGNVHERELFEEAAFAIGWEVVIDVACTADRACALLATGLVDGNRPDLVLLDAHLNGNVSVDLLARLRAHDATAAMPVIILATTVPTAAARNRFLALGAQQVLEKCRDFTELLRFVAMLHDLLVGTPIGGESALAPVAEPVPQHGSR